MAIFTTGICQTHSFVGLRIGLDAPMFELPNAPGHRSPIHVVAGYHSIRSPVAGSRSIWSVDAGRFRNDRFLTVDLYSSLQILSNDEYRRQP